VSAAKQDLVPPATQAQPGAAAAELPHALADLTGCMVSRLQIDDAVTLFLRAADREVSLRIDGRGSLSIAARSQTFDADADLTSVGCLIELLHQSVRQTALRRDGTLHLQTDGGATLMAHPHPHQVSWAVRSSRGPSASCLAEGMVVWA
jgi:hypothetical protein